MHMNQNQKYYWSKTYECKDDQTQFYFSLGPPFYQLILIVFGLQLPYIIFCIIFTFSVTGVPSQKTLRITMCNLNKQNKLYSQGMVPVYRNVPGKIKWERIRDRPVYEVRISKSSLTYCMLNRKP